MVCWAFKIIIKLKNTLITLLFLIISLRIIQMKKYSQMKSSPSEIHRNRRDTALHLPSHENNSAGISFVFYKRW